MQRVNNRRPCHRASLVAVLLLAALPAGAMDFKLGGDLEGRFDATVTAGTMIRTESPDPDVYGSVAGPSVGLPAGRLGLNGGSSDLNFQKNKPISTVFKAVASLELKRSDFGVFLRAMAWDDTELKNGNRLYGNLPNRFAHNTPLSDAGFAPEAKFSNARISDAYAFGKVSLGGDTTLGARVGRQVLSWGVAQMLGGGINVINPLNVAAQLRPGALPEENKIPVGMVSVDFASGKRWGAEAYVQYEFRPALLPGCGSFFLTTPYIATGCGYVSVLPGLTDPSSLASGRYLHRNPDLAAKDSGQYGASLRYSAEGVNTELRAYAMSYHSRTPGLRGTNANIAGAATLAAAYGSFNPATGAFTRLTDANGARFGLVYAENIHLYGLSFSSRVDPSLRIYGELALRPNQPLNLNTSDEIAAILQRTATTALQLAKNTNAILPGGTFDGYDRYKVTTGTLGVSKLFDKAWAADQLTLTGEFGWSHVSDLPDQGVLRYGRSDLYGVAALNGQACTDSSAAKKSCAHDGFVSSDAAGFRLRLAASYAGLLLGARLTPSLTFAQDVSGYSYDGGFLKDRQTLLAAIRSEWNGGYYVELQYMMISGGDYNTLVDRDNLSLVVGAKF